jgi:serine/threonine protein kinase/ankyrin repeat protein
MSTKKKGGKKPNAKKAIFAAVRNNDISEAEKLISNGNFDLNNSRDDDMTVLMEACGQGLLDMTHMLLAMGADARFEEPRWNGSALREACQHGHADIVTMLIGAGADKSRALKSACIYRHLDLVKILIGLGADQYVEDGVGKNAFMNAIYGGSLDIVKYLLSIGRESDILFVNTRGETGLHIASDLSIVKYLVEGGVDISLHCFDEKYTALICAAECGRVDVVEYLLGHGADVTAQCNKGWDALMHASYHGRLETVCVLLTAGAPAYTLDAECKSALTVAIEEGEADVAMFILRHLTEGGAEGTVDFLICTSEGKTPLMLAIEKEQEEVVGTLLEHSLPICLLPDNSVVHIPPEKHKYTWTQVLCDRYANAVQGMLRKYHAHASLLAYSQDLLGRRAINIAEPLCRAAFRKHIFFCGLYQFDPTALEHRSATSVVYLASMSQGAEQGQGQDYARQKVALKFMKDRSQFDRERSIRETGNLSAEFTLQLLSHRSADDDTEFATELAGQGLEEYRHMIVMLAADRSLRTIITHDHIAGSDMETVKQLTKQMIHCLEHVHTQGIVHGDLKPLNVVRYGFTLKLIDFDASATFPTEKKYRNTDDAGYCPAPAFCMGGKHSAAYVPPEMLYEDLATDDTEGPTIRLKSVPCGESGDSGPFLVASPSFDIWSLGVVLYELCTDETLFHSDGQDNIDDEKLIQLYQWSDFFKESRLRKIQDPSARNLVAQLLTKDPSRRPSLSRALGHPFFTGKSFTRLVGQKPCYDVFISYRVASDSRHAETLYRRLTGTFHLSVFWDSVSLIPGQPWDEGFCNGLVQSRAFVPLLSRGALRSLPTLNAHSLCDSVLLEYRLAQEFREMGLLDHIFPVFIGDTLTTTPQEYSHYFSSGCHPVFNASSEEGEIGDCDQVVNSVEQQVSQHFNRLSLGAPLFNDVTIQDVLRFITKNQGFFIRGSFEDCFSRCAETISKMVASDNSITVHNKIGVETISFDKVTQKTSISVKENDIITAENRQLMTERDLLLSEIFRLKAKINCEHNEIPDNICCSDDKYVELFND